MAYYFASDIHLGLSYKDEDPGLRERRLVEWLHSIRSDCQGLFLVGDIFDFWFEYKRVVPKGFVRTLGVLADMCDNGIPVHFFPGNHDLWVGDYLSREIGIEIHATPRIFDIDGTRIFIAHGDGLGKSDWQYWLLSHLFHSRVLRLLFSRLIHPDMALRFGQWWSTGNRHSRADVGHTFRGQDEPIVRYAQKLAADNPDLRYVVCGHLHTPVVFPIGESGHPCDLVVLGQWITRPVVGRLSDGDLSLVEL